jgi:hypothetical protein
MTIATSRTGWVKVRTPRWMMAGAAVMVAGLVLASLEHHPSVSQRVTDLQSVVSNINTGVESCAGGITDSRTAATAVMIANDAAANCSPANSMPMDDLVQYQVPESLAKYNLQATVNDVVTWAFPLAQRVQVDMGALASATTPAQKATATATLNKDQQALDAQRAKIYAAFAAANKGLSAHVTPPNLPA